MELHPLYNTIYEEMRVKRVGGLEGAVDEGCGGGVEG